MLMESCIWQHPEFYDIKLVPTAPIISVDTLFMGWLTVVLSAMGNNIGRVKF